MNKIIFSFILLICPWFGTASAAPNHCDEVTNFFNQFTTEDFKEHLKVETLPEILSDATEGSEGALYRDDSEKLRLIELIHYGETGKQLVSYTIFDERNYRVNISRVVYDKPINTANDPVIKDSLEKRIDICDGVEVDVYTDSPESRDLRFYPLTELLQSISHGK